MNFESLVNHINIIQTTLQAQAAHSVNLALTSRNWLMGCYIVEFEQPETAACAQLTDDGLINNNDRIPVLDHETVIPVKHSLFYKDALIFDQLKSRTVALKHKESGHGILVTFPDFDYLGVWSSANDGPFVALEPWSGTSTCSDEDDVFEHKRGVRFLEPGEHETLSFVIEILI
mgnify:CR=1 FL=1